MIQLAAKNEEQAKAEAIKISNENPGSYVTIAAVFGLFACLHKRLNVHAPTDGPYSWYVLNGSVRGFSDRQKIADQNATPELY